MKIARSPISAICLGASVSLTPQPHETDILALIRLCDVHAVPIATNLASAEIFIRALDQGDLDWRTLRKNNK